MMYKLYVKSETKIFGIYLTFDRDISLKRWWADVTIKIQTYDKQSYHNRIIFVQCSESETMRTDGRTRNYIHSEYFFFRAVK